MTPLLDIANLNLWLLPKEGEDTLHQKQLLRNVALQLAAGQTTALVGESGSGKTLTALSILRLVEETIRVATSGTINFLGQNLLQCNRQQIRAIRGNEIAMIFQEPMTSLNPVYTIGNQLCEPLMLHQHLTRHEALGEAVRLLERTGIPEPALRLHSYPHQLSGGQRQRVMIAMALACRPRLLIADEPTTALDVTVQQQILELLADIQAESNMALLLISHDLQLVRRLATTTAIMQEGEVVESGPTTGLMASPAHPYTRHLLASQLGVPPAGRQPGPIILETRNLNCQFTLKKGGWLPFTGDRSVLQVLADVNLTFAAGTTTGIIGESGSGKTTLAMAILKLVRSSGAILYRDQDLQKLSGKRMRPLRGNMQIVFQDPFSSLSPRRTVEQIVSEGLAIHRPEASRAERRRLVAEALEEVGLDESAATRYPHEFSGGQRQRVAIARVLVLKPQLLILDEPTSALDVTIQAQIIELLRELQRSHQLTYIFISHDLRVIRALADQIIVLKDGRVVESGSAAAMFNQPRKRYTRQLFQASLDLADLPFLPSGSLPA